MHHGDFRKRRLFTQIADWTLNFALLNLAVCYEQGLNYIDKDGQPATVTNFEDFCAACGFSPRKVYEALQNLNYFGEEFMETSQRLGLGYREMRKLR